MKSQAKNVADYLKELPADRAQAVGKICELIRSVAPQAVESMQYGMPTYEYHGALFSVASQKQHMAVYVCDAERVEKYRAELAPLNIGKGCIRFRRLDMLPWDVLERLLREVWQVRQAEHPT